MPDIRYICLSDMHLGEEDSLLTNLKEASTELDPFRASPVMERLVECIRSLLKENKDRSRKPTLILNGDILEMALSTDNLAAMVFERLLELVMPPGGELFEKIIYNPGNHDHHLWESARETQYVNFVAKIKPGSPLDIPWHTTNLFVDKDEDPIPLYFPTRLVQRYSHLKSFVIAAAYTNFGLLSKDGCRCVVFSHGHFIESLYLLMSNVMSMIFPKQKIPEFIWNVEALNFAWIDFFWSTMGRSGDVGKDIEIIYEKLQDKEEFKKLLYNLADSLARKYDLPGWGDRMEAAVLKVVFNAAVEAVFGTERTKGERLLSPDAEKGLWWYMNVPLRHQIDNECKEKKLKVPTDMTFVFGHTHKPFQEDMNFKEYPGWVNVYNTGGWVVETVDPQPLHGGAMVLVDEDLNAVSIRLYNEAGNPKDYRVRVEEATHGTDEHNPFFRRMTELVDPGGDPWKSFSEAAARAVHVRAQNLRARINEKS
jgi:UDP-2,3-diacylglucosamine pyrophosphatase LpxH